MRLLSVEYGAPETFSCKVSVRESPAGNIKGDFTRQGHVMFPEIKGACLDARLLPSPPGQQTNRDAVWIDPTRQLPVTGSNRFMFFARIAGVARQANIGAILKTEISRKRSTELLGRLVF
jgi:hypothetical protein